MARRRRPGGGRKPRGEFSGKSAVFSTRITPQTRKQLDRAAADNDRSLSQEIEHRLRESFYPDQKRPARIRALGEMVKLTAEIIEQATGAAWLADGFTAGSLRHALDFLIDHFGPVRADQATEVPARVEEMASVMPPPLGEGYRRPIGLAAIETRHVIALIEGGSGSREPSSGLEAVREGSDLDRYRRQLFRDLVAEKGARK